MSKTNDENWKLRLLIVEDSQRAARDLQFWFDRHSASFNVEIEIDLARTVGEGRAALKSKLYHAMSIDQNMPDAPGGVVSAEHGRNFLESVSKAGIPVFAAMYTAYPDLELAHQVGRSTGFDYKVKSTKTEGVKMEPDAYVNWFLAELKQEYLKRVLRRLSESGHADLAENARLSAQELDRALTTRQDADMTRLMQRLNLLREALLINLVGLTKGLLAYAKIKPDLDPNPTQAASVEDWLSRSWQRLESDITFRKLKNYLGVGSKRSMASAYLSDFRQLRRDRNKVAHGLVVDYTFDIFQQYTAALFRMTDLAIYFVTRRMIYNPYQPRTGVLSFTELRGTFYSPEEISFAGIVPTQPAANAVFTQIVDGDPLIPLTSGFECFRDNKGAPRLRKYLGQ